MNWFSKALIFKVLSTVPGGAALYRHAQWKWTKSIVATPNWVGQKVDVGMSYLNWLLEHGYSLEKIRTMRHLDLGTGWHPTIPLLFSRIGLRDQVLADVNPLMTGDTFLDALAITNGLLGDESHPARKYLLDTSIPEKPPESELDKLLTRYEMAYHAPYFEWAATTGQQIDFVTCTQVLMHLERPILDGCFKLVHGILKPGGLFMVPVHLFDIYSNSDPHISVYNHLRYSRRFWKSVVSSDMMTFNRLKSPDYRSALEGAGFEIIEFHVDYGTEAELQALRSLEIHPEFLSKYTNKELSEKHLFFVARKP